MNGSAAEWYTTASTERPPTITRLASPAAELDRHAQALRRDIAVDAGLRLLGFDLLDLAS